MIGFKLKEVVSGVDVEYSIEKNGTHSGQINVTVNGDPVIENLNFTTAFELAYALQRAQIAALSKTCEAATVKSALEGGMAQEFVKNMSDHLRKMAVAWGGDSGVKAK